jgi:hypothetical protein
MGSSGQEPNAERRKLCLIQSGSSQRRPLDFHSFRRAYDTALADANVNVQNAMPLAGHRNASTHMLYVMRTGRLATPSTALPSLAKIGLRRAPNAARLLLDEVDGQNTNGTSTVRQGAVFSGNLEIGLGHPISNLEPGLGSPGSENIVGHEGLEPSTNGLRIHTGGGTERRESGISAGSRGGSGARELSGTPEQAEVCRTADPVEAALANALQGATAAGQWAVVSQLAAELEARRRAPEMEQPTSAVVIPLRPR